MRTVLAMEQLRQTDPTVMALMDTSLYNPDLPITNQYLEIVPPGFTGKVQHIFLTQGVTLVTAVSLGLNSSRVDLTSGIYKVRQTIKPNDQLYADHYFAFVVPERKQLTELVCKALDARQDLTPYYHLTAELDIIEWVAKEGDCKKAEHLLMQVQNKLKTLCAEHV